MCVEERGVNSLAFMEMCGGRSCYTDSTDCFAVGEEDEVSIKEAADAVLEAMEFKGEVVVSFPVLFIWVDAIFVADSSRPGVCARIWSDKATHL